MTKDDLRKASGISTTSLSKLKKGQNITTDVLLKICHTLNCNLTDIMEHINSFGKNTSLLCILLLLFAVSSFTSLAQSEWQWAKSYTGQDAFGGEPNNEIICTDFDADGNIYIMGTFGHGALIDNEKIFPDSIYHKITLALSHLGMSLDHAQKGTLIAKFSPQGEMLWKKVIRMHSSVNAEPAWMELKEDRIHFLGNLGFEQALYYLDTLVLETDYAGNDSLYADRPVPYQHKNLNCFVTFDLDGNVLEEHFLRLFQRESALPFYPHTGRLSLGVFIQKSNPFHVDKNGNIYILAKVNHWGAPVEEPLTIVVDEEKSFDFYTHRTCAPEQGNLADWILFKFSPDWNLLWYKQLADHITGVDFEVSGHSNTYWPYIHDLSFDDEDNLYVCGHIRLDMVPESAFTYPVKLYWDSVHHTVMSGKYATTAQSFLCKYDTAGNVQWTKQLYPLQSGGDSHLKVSTYFRDVIVKENDVYVFGSGDDLLWENLISDIFIDEELTIPVGRLGNQQARSFYIKYDRLSGEYIDHSFVSHENIVMMEGKASIMNNHIVFSNRVGLAFDTLLLSYFRDDGRLMDVKMISRNLATKQNFGNVRIHESGKLFFDVMTNSSITIGDFHFDANGPNSMVAFALMEDSSLLIPYEYNDTLPDYVPSFGQERRLYFTPNPASGNSTLCGHVEGYQKMELYDLSGRKLTETHSFTINLLPYAPGIYLVKIHFEKGGIATRKVVRGVRE